MQQRIDHAVAIAPDLRHLHRNQAHQQTAQTEAQRQRQRGLLELLPGKTQQAQKLRRQHPGHQAQQHEQRHFQPGNFGKHRHHKHRLIPGQAAHGDIGDHRCNDHGTEMFHHNCAEHDFGHKKRARNRRVISGGNPGGCACWSLAAPPPGLPPLITRRLRARFLCPKSCSAQL